MPGPAKNPIGSSGGKLPPPSTPKIKSGSSSFQMPTSSSSQVPKTKSGSGLKILWIPGRRKHHDKGVYKPSNYNIEHKHGDRKNDTWNLGGSKSHEDILTGGWVQWTFFTNIEIRQEKPNIFMTFCNIPQQWKRWSWGSLETETGINNTSV